MRAVIDHIVCGCEQLDTGTAHLEHVIGKDFVAGGKHDLMATHNRLLKLQDSIYFEAIAIDHGAGKNMEILVANGGSHSDEDRTKQS